MTISLLSVATAIRALVARFFFHATVAGWTAEVVLVSLLAAVQLLMIGILGEYGERIYEQVKERPLYVVGGPREPRAAAGRRLDRRGRPPPPPLPSPLPLPPPSLLPLNSPHPLNPPQRERGTIAIYGLSRVSARMLSHGSLPHDATSPRARAINSSPPPKVSRRTISASRTRHARRGPHVSQASRQPISQAHDPLARCSSSRR